MNKKNLHGHMICVHHCRSRKQMSAAQPKSQPRRSRRYNLSDATSFSQLFVRKKKYIYICFLIIYYSQLVAMPLQREEYVLKQRLLSQGVKVRSHRANISASHSVNGVCVRLRVKIQHFAVPTRKANLHKRDRVKNIISINVSSPRLNASSRR